MQAGARWRKFRASFGARRPFVTPNAIGYFSRAICMYIYIYLYLYTFCVVFVCFVFAARGQGRMFPLSAGKRSYQTLFVVGLCSVFNFGFLWGLGGGSLSREVWGAGTPRVRRRVWGRQPPRGRAKLNTHLCSWPRARDDVSDLFFVN